MQRSYVSNRMVFLRRNNVCLINLSSLTNNLIPYINMNLMSSLKEWQSGDIGTTTMGFRRPDNISFVVFFNHDYGESLYIDGTVNTLGNALSNAADVVSQWPDTDLFPSVGIPVFFHLTT
jgi:hypothetical protein